MTVTGYTVFSILIVTTSCVRGLECYDSISNDDIVVIGCDFPGASCAITKETITTMNDTMNNRVAVKTETKFSYHCANRNARCLNSRVLDCFSAIGEKQSIACETACCDFDRCNWSANDTRPVKPSSSTSKECYQLIENKEQVVRCQFQDSKCLYFELTPWPPDPYDGFTYFKFCATQKSCNQWKNDCDFFVNSSRFLRQTCSMRCCDGKRCNVGHETIVSTKKTIVGPKGNSGDNKTSLPIVVITAIVAICIISFGIVLTLCLLHKRKFRNRQPRELPLHDGYSPGLTM